MLLKKCEKEHSCAVWCFTMAGKLIICPMMTTLPAAMRSLFRSAKTEEQKPAMSLKLNASKAMQPLFLLTA